MEKILNTKILLSTILLTLLTLSGCASTGPSSSPGAKAEVRREANAALKNLFQESSEARRLSANAKGILVFPEIVKAGFIVGAHLGNGVLIKNGRVSSYYNSTAVSYGLQAGVQVHGYALFLMTNAALSHIENSAGWEIGVGPSIVLVKTGAGKTMSTTTAKDGIYAFIFDQKGVMAGLGLQGTKITRIDP
jgi:lipid-binding SYLF domain-containing protein